MKKIEITQLSWEELQKRFDNQDILLKDILKNLEQKSPSEFLTRQQAAKLLNVDLSTIWNWSKQKKIQPLGIGGRILFRRSDIDKYMEEL